MVENLCSICQHTAELLWHLGHQEMLHVYINTPSGKEGKGRERKGGRERERERERGGEGRGEGEMEVKAGNGYLTGYGLV